jgi:glycerol-3-phosphate dehydrogenase
MYGARAGEVLKLADGDDTLKMPVESGLPPLLVEAAWAARHEDARHLKDFFLRRSFLGLVLPTESAGLVKTAEAMGNELGWDAERKRQEVDDLRKILQEQHR